MVIISQELSGAEKERLHKLCQECGEIIQAATKALMYGWTPQHQGVLYDNRADLERELADLRNIEELMLDKGDISATNIEQAALGKRKRMLEHLRHQQEPET